MDPLDALRRPLAEYRARRAVPAPDVRHAAVALVVRPGEHDLELLLIKRAEHQDDPWSGHMALPGGRRDPGDRSALHTALRESHEEVGLDLAEPHRALGRLDDVQPAAGAPRILISPFVFAADAGATARPNHEVQAAFWVPLGTLAAPGAATEYLHALADGRHRSFPALAYREHVVWGLTYRIVTRFLEITRTAGAGGRDG